jgi:hypothetical protein
MEGHWLLWKYLLRDTEHRPVRCQWHAFHQRLFGTLGLLADTFKPEAGSVELRNMQIATPEGTVMMKY